MFYIEVTSFDPCTGCEIPCTKHVSYPLDIVKEIDQSDMNNSLLASDVKGIVFGAVSSVLLFRRLRL